MEWKTFPISMLQCCWMQFFFVFACHGQNKQLLIVSFLFIYFSFTFNIISLYSSLFLSLFQFSLLFVFFLFFYAAVIWKNGNPECNISVWTNYFLTNNGNIGNKGIIIIIIINKCINKPQKSSPTVPVQSASRWPNQP